MAQKSFDLLVSDCKKDIIGVLNNSGLPISVLAMIVKEVNDMVVIQNNNTIKAAQEAYDEELKRETKEKKSK